MVMIESCQAHCLSLLRACLVQRALQADTIVCKACWMAWARARACVTCHGENKLSAFPGYASEQAGAGMLLYMCSACIPL